MVHVNKFNPRCQNTAHMGGVFYHTARAYFTVDLPRLFYNGLLMLSARRYNKNNGNK